MLSIEAQLVELQEYAAKEKLVPVLSEQSEVTKRNPAF